MVFSALGEVPKVIPESSGWKLSEGRTYVYYFSWQSFRFLNPHPP